VRPRQPNRAFAASSVPRSRSGRTARRERTFRPEGGRFLPTSAGFRPKPDRICPSKGRILPRAGGKRTSVACNGSGDAGGNLHPVEGDPPMRYGIVGVSPATDVIPWKRRASQPRCDVVGKEPVRPPPPLLAGGIATRFPRPSSAPALPRHLVRRRRTSPCRE
jgi:hypothetical protein